MSSILLFVNRTSRAVVADNVQSSRVFEEELAGLGFQLKERPWYDEPHQVIAELCHNKRVATDMGQSGYSPSRREGDRALQSASPVDSASSGSGCVSWAGPSAWRSRRPAGTSFPASAKPTWPATWLIA